MPRQNRKRSAAAIAYNRWYSTAAWKALRKQQLAAEPLCAMCRQDGVITEATVADHIQPHRGDWDKFIDPQNLQSLCQRHHSVEKAVIDKRGFDTRIGPDGWPVDPRHPVYQGRKDR